MENKYKEYLITIGVTMAFITLLGVLAFAGSKQDDSKK
jgi:hypothetical protein